MKEMIPSGRREFLKKSGILITTAAVLRPSRLLAQETAKPNPETKPTQQGEVEISPVEDLMREHAALARVLLVYDEIVRRLNSGKEFPPETLANATGLIRRFVEDYHEKLEENHLFPRFEKAGKFVSLVKILLQQHQVGRLLTDRIRRLAAPSLLKSSGERAQVAEDLSLFIKMYRPHKARESTVLFPAFHTVVSREEYDHLGDAFEDEEQKLFGKNGFEKIVDEVAVLEKTLGLDELSRFTPRL
jgi:hemerythrin-like domain-containing protein